MRHLKKVCQKPCQGVTPCPENSKSKDMCYRTQCYATARAIAERLGWSEDFYSVSFQSRLGRTPWIQPYTDRVLPELASKSIKRLAIVAPSFVADCLETLEEINIQARESWIKISGGEFHFIPALNEHPLWVKAIETLIKEM
jgi:ferrochelatase